MNKKALITGITMTLLATATIPAYLLLNKEEKPSINEKKVDTAKLDHHPYDILEGRNCEKDGFFDNIEPLNKFMDFLCDQKKSMHSRLYNDAGIIHFGRDAYFYFRDGIGMVEIPFKQNKSLTVDYNNSSFNIVLEELVDPNNVGIRNKIRSISFNPMNSDYNHKNSKYFARNLDGKVRVYDSSDLSGFLNLKNSLIRN